MNELSFENIIKNNSYKKDFFEWISLTKYKINLLENNEKIKCFKYFNNNKDKIIELKNKILDYRI